MISFAAVCGVLSVVIGLVGQAYYLRGILNHTFRPHAFSYLVYALLTGIALAAQISDHAGAGIWVTAFTAVFCLYVALDGFFRRGIEYVTREDWFILAGCLLSVPLWLLTKTPLYSVILISVIDVAATLPSLRKAWVLPYEDSMFAYAIASTKFFIGLLAIERFTIVNTLYPIALVVVNGAVVAAILFRRRRGARV